VKRNASARSALGRATPNPYLNMKLTADSIVIGEHNFAGFSPRATREQKAYVLGTKLGPMLLVVTNSKVEATDEWYERLGERAEVDVDADASALADYGPTIDEAIDNAISRGAIRINYDGIMVWVYHYEWCREFESIRAAAEYFRQ